jgi:hypothetical protein
MKNTEKIILYFILTSLVLLGVSCKKDEVDNGVEYQVLEQQITETYKNHPKFTWAQYQELLTELSKDKYVVLPVYLMKDYYDESKVVVCLRHDVDIHIFKALEMAELEYLRGFNSTYYILATASYYGSFRDKKLIRNKCMGEAYIKLNFYGHEIGVHNDLLAVMIDYGNDPFLFNRGELDYYESLGIPIYGTASHGSSIASRTVPNYMMFSDFATKSEVTYKDFTYPIGQHSLADYGYTYEAYFIDFNKYYSDSGGDWDFEGDFDGMLEALKNSVPGDRIQILTHPVWWGKE